MINLRSGNDADTKIIRAFADGDWRTGLQLLGEREKQRAVKELVSVLPTETGAIARAQCAFQIWDKDISCIERDVTEFLAEEAAAKRGS